MEKNIESQSPTDGDVATESGFFLVCCACLTIFAAAAILAAAIFGVRADDSHYARLYIQDLYVPSLVNKTAPFNTSVFVHLTFKRHDALIRHSYRDFRMILSYGEYRSKSIRVGSRMVDGFSMGHKKRVDVKAVVEATEMPCEEAFRAISGGDVVPMLVELKMSDALDEYPLVAVVKVDGSGHMVKRPISLKKWNPRWNV